MADADAPTPDGEQLTDALTKVTPEAPEPAQDLQPAPADEPQVASTVEVPATPATPVLPVSVEAPSAGEGGEWDLLVSKVQAWLASGQLQQQWQTARTPLSLLAGLIALLRG